LNAAWKKWYAVVKDFSMERPERGPAIHTCLLRFCDRHPADLAHVAAVVASLSQGKHLVEAAVRWHEPVAGHPPDSGGTPTDRTRGEQFRLVMAYAGLETVLNALLPAEGRGRQGEAELRGFARQVDPTPPPPPAFWKSRLADVDDALGRVQKGSVRVLARYWGTCDLVSYGWKVHAWTNTGGARGKRGHERLWFSPACLP
jgi:hypothetical protein